MVRGIPKKAFRLTKEYWRLLLDPMIKELNQKGSEHEREITCFYLSMGKTEMYFSGVQALHASMVSRQYIALGQEEFDLLDIRAHTYKARDDKLDLIIIRQKIKELEGGINGY